jgi:hypothetical protein
VREGLQRVKAETPLVGVESRERSGTARVRDPRAERDPLGHVCDRTVGHADQDELRFFVPQHVPTLAQPSCDSGANSA